MIKRKSTNDEKLGAVQSYLKNRRIFEIKFRPTRQKAQAYVIGLFRVFLVKQGGILAEVDEAFDR